MRAHSRAAPAAPRAACGRAARGSRRDPTVGDAPAPASRRGRSVGHVAPAGRRAGLADDSGSAPVEFVLVGLLLTALTLGVLQLGVAVYVRNVVHDAAVTGAHQAALADETVVAGVARSREVIRRTVGEAYAGDVSGALRPGDGAVEIVVRAPLPLLGLWGPAGTMEVRAHAPRETLG